MKYFRACRPLAILTLLITTPNLAVRAEEEPLELAQMRGVYEKDVEFATRPIRDRYVSKLESLKRTLASRGDVRGAVVVQDEIDRLNFEASGVAKFAGVWAVTYDNGGSRVYEIKADGSVAMKDPAGKVIGTAKIFTQKRDFLIEMDKGTLERLSRSAKKLTIEHFSPKSAYPDSSPSIRATGTPAVAAKE